MVFAWHVDAADLGNLLPSLMFFKVLGSSAPEELATARGQYQSGAVRIPLFCGPCCRPCLICVGSVASMIAWVCAQPGRVACPHTFMWQGCAAFVDCLCGLHDAWI